MKQSQQVLEWQAEARAESILRLLELRFHEVPPDLAESLRTTTDFVKLTAWFDLAYSAASIEAFRHRTGLC